MMKKRFALALLVLIFLVGGVFAQEDVIGEPEDDLIRPERAGTADTTVCCEKTNAGLYCQDVKEEDCSSDSFALPTACESTGPCEPGYCYDSEEGTCLDNVPQMVCDEEEGTWSREKPEVCNLGCCILGDQAAFVTGVRCKRLSSFYGLETDFNPEIGNEVQCILTAKADEVGACVYKGELGEDTCERLTRSQCTPERIFDTETGGGETPGGGNLFEDSPEDEAGDENEGEEIGNEEEEPEDEGGDDVQESPPQGCEILEGGIRFCPGMLCSAEDLGTECGPSEETTCVDGKEEVYFVDTCGNVANIYDAERVNDDSYWKYIVDKSEACGAGRDNIDSQTCGNCNYLMGSYCAETSSETTSPTYGSSICVDLNCESSDMTGGEERLHGESWCIFDEDRDFTFQEQEEEDYTAENSPFAQQLQEALGKLRSGASIGNEFRGSDAPVGSKFYRALCSHGEVLIEPCADFRQETCIENEVAGYTEAACRVNRWQDCTTQYTKADCENGDQRDCMWMDGIQYVLIGGLSNGSTLDKSSLQAAKGELKKFNSGDRELGGCVPKTAPGLKFWGGGEEEEDNSEASTVCSQANAMCPVTYEKGLLDGDWECVENCECLEEQTELARAQLCMALGDCGPKVNYVGVKGRTVGYKIFEEELESG